MAEPLWTPSSAYVKESSLYRYQQFVEQHYNRTFLDYESFYDWSTSNIDDFWKSIIEYFEIDYSGNYDEVCTWDKEADNFTDVTWFEGISLSYAAKIFKNRDNKAIAIKYGDEITEYREVTWGELRYRVSSLQQFLQAKGIEKGDRVAGLLGNNPDSTALFLAVNSLGAIWSCCSLDFGDKSIEERFEQIKPKLLFAEDSYQYNGKKFSKEETINHLKSNIESIESTIIVDSDLWIAIFESYTPRELTFAVVPFDHPIWILYSSGTTGKPKAITHRTGGNLIEHFKALALHQNVQAGENYLWYTTTGWMMWNYALSSLLCGATLCIFDGAINHNNHQTFWDFVKRSKVDHLGAGAAYFSATHDLEVKDYSPKVIGSTGSPLPVATFENLQQKFPDVHIISLSGGTDVCSAFLSGCPLLPVYAGKIQCRTLGSDIVALNDDAEEVYNQVGELVIKQPMPSMPLYFWNDEGKERYKASYFSERPGFWSHGDWISIDDTGIEMFGRSDATLNRGGVRIGTAEIYNAVNSLDAVLDSLVISTEDQAGHSAMILFVQLKEGISFGEEVERAIKIELRKQYSPRHVPDQILHVAEIPYTLSGKKLEIPIKKLFSGQAIDKSTLNDLMRNPNCLDEYELLKNKIG